MDNVSPTLELQGDTIGMEKPGTVGVVEEERGLMMSTNLVADDQSDQLATTLLDVTKTNLGEQ